MINENFYGSLADFFDWLTDGGEWRVDECSHVVVAEADYCNVFWNVQALFADGLDGFYGCGVVDGEDGIGNWVEAEQVFDIDADFGYGEVVGDDEVFMNGEFVFAVGCFVACEAFFADEEIGGAGEVCDAGTSLPDEVFYDAECAIVIVYNDFGNLHVVAYAVEEDEGNAFSFKDPEVVEVAGVFGDGDDESVDLAIEHAFGVGNFGFVTFVGVADDEVVACFGGSFLGANDSKREEGTDELWDDHADGMAGFFYEADGVHVAVVVHLFGECEDGGAGGWFDFWVAGKGSGDGGFGNVECFGNVNNGGLMLFHGK